MADNGGGKNSTDRDLEMADEADDIASDFPSGSPSMPRSPSHDATEKRTRQLSQNKERDLESGSLLHIATFRRASLATGFSGANRGEPTRSTQSLVPPQHGRAETPGSPMGMRKSMLRPEGSKSIGGSVTGSRQSVKWSQDIPIESHDVEVGPATGVTAPTANSSHSGKGVTDGFALSDPAEASTVSTKQPATKAETQPKTDIPSLTITPPIILKTADLATVPNTPNTLNTSGPGAPGTPFINPFHTAGGAKKRKGSTAAGGGRRMSLGAALCIPPPPRMSNKMSPLKFLQLSVGAIGIIFGEMSVSPLFLLKAIFHVGPDDPEILHTEDDILGAISLLIWIVTLVCCVKYIWLVLKADKNGEGGTWALISLLPMDNPDLLLWKHRGKIYLLGLLAASFLIGDAVISPAITVLSAFEGVREYAHAFTEWAVVGCTCAILVIMFSFQRFGTASVQKLYGPTFILWFIVIAMIGLYNISTYPKAFAAVSPHYFFIYIRHNAMGAFVLLSQIVLAVAGVEAMYADLGHFSTMPIRASLLCVVYPSLILSYIGQGAYLVMHPDATRNPFFMSVPNSVKWPVLVLATAAAIMAAQGSITGCSTLIDQSISLNAFPNLKTSHPNPNNSEVYIPFVNWAILTGSVTLALAFRSSEGLANTAGICVAGSMTVTSFLYSLVMRYGWNFPLWRVLLFASLFLTLDVLLFASSLRKVTSMGWVSILIAAVLFVVMYSWYATTNEVNEWLHDRLLAMGELRQYVRAIPRTPGTVVFVSNTDEDVPNVLNICARRLNSLPANIVCMTAVAQPAPFVAKEEKTVFRTIDAMQGIYRLVISYGYAERSIDVVLAMERAKKRGLRMQNNEEVVFIVGRELVQSGPSSPWYTRLRRNIFDTFSKNTQNKIDYYNLPHASTLEMATNVILDAEKED